MAGRVLLDTNAVIALLAGDGDLRVKVADAEAVFVSATAAAEHVDAGIDELDEPFQYVGRYGDQPTNRNT